MHFDHIIIATDLSEHSGAAARWVSSVKEALSAKVVVTHVIEVSVKSWLTSALDILEEGQEPRRAKAEANIQAWYKDMTGVEPNIVSLRGGGVLTQLTELNDELGGKNIIVMAASGHGAINRMLLGSNAQSVASAPPCPLVVVHPDHDSFSARPIVVGTDFSPNADKAVRFAVDFCTLTQAPIRIVHANPIPPIVLFDGGDVPTAALEQSATEWSNEQMRLLVDRHTGLSALDVKTSVSQTSPSDALAETAVANDSDLIVVGHSGESELMQNVLGSVAQRTLNRMPCTLMIIPHV